MVTCFTLGVRLGSSVTEVAPEPIRATLASLARSDCYIELQTKVREDFTITEKAPTDYLIVSSHFSSHSWGWTMRPWNLSWPGSAGRCGFS